MPPGVYGLPDAVGEQPVETVLLGDETRAGADDDERGLVANAGVEAILVTMPAVGTELHDETPQGEWRKDMAYSAVADGPG